MSSENLHRQAIVRALIRGCESIRYSPLNKRDALAFYNDQEGDHESAYGCLWMGLWLGQTVKLNDGGLTLFPRWLAEVLNEECNLNIQEEDIYE